MTKNVIPTRPPTPPHPLTTTTIQLPCLQIHKFFVTDAARSEKVVASAKIEEIRLTILNTLLRSYPELGEHLAWGSAAARSSVVRDVDPTAPLGRRRRSIQTQIEVRESSNGAFSTLLVNTLDRPGLLTGGWVRGLAGWRAGGRVPANVAYSKFSTLLLASEKPPGRGRGAHPWMLAWGSGVGLLHRATTSHRATPRLSRSRALSSGPDTSETNAPFWPRLNCRHRARAQGHQPQRGQRRGGHHRPQRLRQVCADLPWGGAAQAHVRAVHQRSAVLS